MIKYLLLFVNLCIFISIQGQIITSDEIPKSKYDETNLTSKKIEDYGGNPFYEGFYGVLKIIPQGNGTSKIIDESGSARFNKEFLNKYFVGFRIHQNPIEHPSVAKSFDYYPGILSCRYSHVIKIVNANTLLVDFEYNGGNIKKALISEKASGEFFFDNNTAITQAIQNEKRSDILLFESGKTYVSIGSWNAKVNLSEKPLILKSSSSKVRSNIKISAEDAFTVNRGGGRTNEKNMKKWFVKGGALINLGVGDNDCLFKGINILATTFTAKRANYGYNYSIFNYKGGQCERVVGIENCNTQYEKELLIEQNIKLPKGANWVAPDFGYFAGGGKHDENDLTGYQVIRQYNSILHSATPYSIKNNNGAGNFQEIIGLSAKNRSEVVEIVTGLKLGVSGTGKYNGENGEVLKTKVSFHDDENTYTDIKKKKSVPYGARLIKIHDNSISWYMLSNQYWTGGTSAGMTEPVTVIVEGFEFRFGNNGDWRPVMGYKNPNKDNWSIKNSQEARMFNKIPIAGKDYLFKKIAAKKKKKKKNKFDQKKVAYSWDFTCQVGDVFIYKGISYRVEKVKRRGGNGHALNGWNPSKKGLLFGYGLKPKGGEYNSFMHLNEIIFDKVLPENLDEFSMKCKVSKAEYLLDGEPRDAELVYDRDFNGHCMYNRMYVNQYFKNVYFKGYFRTTGDMYEGTFQDLWNFPRVRTYENVEHNGGGQHLAKCIKFRYDIEKNEKYKNTFITGGKMTIDNTKEPLEFVYSNRPSGIAYNKLIDPIMLDKKGFNQIDNYPWGNMKIELTKGQTLYLYDVIHNSNLTLTGNGKFVLKNVEIKSDVKKSANLIIVVDENNLQVNGDNIDVDEIKIIGRKGFNAVNTSLNIQNVDVKNVKIDRKLSAYNICNRFIVNGDCIEKYSAKPKKKSKRSFPD